MFNRFTKRDGPLFRENVVVDGKLGVLEGDLDNVVVKIDGQKICGKPKLVATKEAGRLTRTWILENGNQLIIFGEEGLTAGAGNPERRRG